MKKMFKKVLVFSLVVVALLSCRPENRYEIGDPSDKIAGISDSWTISSVILIDEASLNKSQVDISSFYLQGDQLMTMEFTETNYTVTEGTGKNFFGASGTWAFDDPVFPTQVTLSPENGSDIVLSLLGPIREVDQELRIQYTRGCGPDSPTVSYNFTFNRQ